MSAADGSIIGTTKIVDNGSPENRFNLVLVAEGYTQDELPKFATDAQSFLDKFFSTAPFKDLQCAFNVYRIDVASNESGADDPEECEGTGATPATYFDGTFCTGNPPIKRLLHVNTQSVRDVVEEEIPQWHSILVIVNSPIYGGAGGAIATTSTSPGWENIPLHEIGHSTFGLADEYQSWASCGEEGHDNYAGAEPASPNVTTNIDRATIKWKELILPATPLPTTDNPDCGSCDFQPNPVSDDTVGAFEGARYYHCDIYRPQYSCMMRNYAPFCAVCQKAIIQTLTPYLPAGCYAPVFKKSNWIVCIIKNMALLLVIIALIILVWIPGILCIIKKLAYEMNKCTVGNNSRCIKL